MAEPAITKTAILELNKPDKGYFDWDVPLNANWDKLDAVVGKLGYEHSREIAVSGNTTVAIQDTDKILSLPVSAKATITFDTSALTFPEFFYTVQILVYFTSGVKTVTLAKSGGSINWVNANAPSFASGKPHWLTLRIGQTWSNVLMSDAGEEG